MPNTAAKNARQDHPVSLSVNNKGEFTYSPSFVRAKRGDTVTFSAEDGHLFAVMFKDRSPGDRLSLSNNHPSITIDDDAPYAVYHYAAAISNTEDGTLHLDSGCGDVGVES